MNAACPTSPRPNALRLAVGTALASAFASATDIAFSTYFGLVLVVLAMPQLVACLRAAAKEKR